jgi:hypothetical protein
MGYGLDRGKRWTCFGIKKKMKVKFRVSEAA